MSSSKTPNQKIYLDISLATILKIWLVLVIFWFLYQIREVLVILFASIFLSLVISPLVDQLEKKKIPRGLGALIVYLIVLGLIGGFLAFLIPPLIEQTKEFGHNLPDYASRLSNLSQQIKISFEHLGSPSPEVLQSVGEKVGSLVANAYNVTVGILGGFFTTLLIIVLSFYMVVEKKSLEETLLVVLSASKVKRIMRIFEDIEIKISHWLQGQLVLMLAVGSASYLALLILGVRYALTLGLMAGILEAIPYIGPLTSTIVASLVALVNEGPMVAFWVAVSFIIIQQLENHILVPKIMGKFVGLSPVVIIIAMIVGGKFLGLGGIILAIPIATSLAVIIKDFVENPLS